MKLSRLFPATNKDAMAQIQRSLEQAKGKGLEDGVYTVVVEAMRSVRACQIPQLDVSSLSIQGNS